MPNKKNIIILHDPNTKLQIFKSWSFFPSSQLLFLAPPLFLTHALLPVAPCPIAFPTAPCLVTFLVAFQGCDCPL